MTSRIWTIAATTISLALLANGARAEDRPQLEDSYFAVKATLGLGGSRSIRSDSASIGGVTVNVSDPATRSNSLTLSYGIAGQYMVALHRYFALGGLLGVQSWQSSTGSDNNLSRNLALDLAAVPEGRLPIAQNLELYVALPIGLTFNFWNEVERSAAVGNGAIANANVDANTAVGLGLSLLVGARLALLGNFGVFTEFGYTHRQFSHEVTWTASAAGIGLGSAKADADVSFDQFAWNLGAFF